MYANESAQSCDQDDDISSRGSSVVFASMFSVCAVVGVAGNILILIVYQRDRARVSPAVYVQALAMVDLAVCGVVVPYTVAFEWGEVTQDTACRVLELTRHTLVILSAFILSAVAAERYLAVFQPVRVHTVQRAKKVVAGIFAGSLAFAFPCVFTFTVSASEEERDRPHRNASYVTLRMTSEGEASPHCHFTMEIIGVLGTRAYHVTLALQHVICVSLTIFLYLKVYFAIWRRERFKMKVRPDPQRNRSARTGKDLSALRSTPNCIPLPAVSPAGKLRAADIDKRDILQLNAVSLVCEHPALSKPKQRKESVKKSIFRTTGIDKESRNDGNQPSQSQRKIISEQNGDAGQNACRKGPDFNNQNSSIVKVSESSNDYIVAISSAAPPDVACRQDRWRKAGTMMAVCTLTHIVLWLPFWIDLFNITQSVIFRYTFLFSHATNPVVYGVFSSNIRKGLKRVLSCK